MQCSLYLHVLLCIQVIHHSAKMVAMLAHACSSQICQEVRGSILFSRVHGVKCRTANLNPMRKAFLGFCLGGLPCCLVLLPF